MAQIVQAVGIDCGQRWLDAAVYPTGDRLRVENSEAGRQHLLEWLQAYPAARVGVEASGGYERPIRDRLCQAGRTVHVLDPARVRHFAKAKGRRAKTDRLDAAVIAEVTATMTDRVPVTPDPGRETLAGVLRARRLLVDKRADLTKALTSAPEAARPALRHAIEHMTAAIETLEGEIAARQAADAALTRTLQALQSAPGLGPVVALTLAVRVPELGHTSANRIAALLGVAPFDQDSGNHHGVRRIAGGRAEARQAVYMATLSAATRSTGVLARFYAQLLARGKPPKVALTACMRKLIVRLNAMLAHQQTWQEHPA